jgi:hypothetical protein
MPEGRMHNRRSSGVLIAFLVAILIAPMLGVVYLLPPVGPNCLAGPVVAAYNYTLTPSLVLNSPYLGSASGIYHAHDDPALGNGSFVFPATNGDVWGFFENYRWVISTGSPARSGISCAGVFLARGTLLGGGGLSLMASGMRNDSTEPTQVGDNGTSYAVIDYNNSFARATNFVSTCGTNPKSVTFSSDRIDIGIPFQLNGTNESVQVSVYPSMTFSYTFPADTGVWQVDNLSAPGGPGGGWAFSYLPCPP